MRLEVQTVQLLLKQNQQLQKKLDEIREYINKNVFVGQEFKHKETKVDKDTTILGVEVISHDFKLLKPNKNFIVDLLKIIEREGVE